MDGTLRTGNITTVAGTGAAGFSGDGGQATAAALNAPSDVAVAPDGTMYIADLSNRRVRKVTPQGVISTYAGNGIDRIGPDGVIATQASIREPTHIALGADGSLYITDRPGNQIRKVAPDGTISVFAGRGTPGGNLGEGERAQDTSLDGPVGIAVLPSGEVVFSDRNNQRIKLVDNAGNLFTIAGSGRTGDGQTATDTRYGEFEPNFTPRLNDNCSGLGVAPTLPCATANRDTPSARFDRPLGVAAAPDGSIYIADQQDHVVRRLAPKSVINEVFTLPGSGRSGTGAAGIHRPREPHHLPHLYRRRHPPPPGRQEPQRLRRLPRRGQRLLGRAAGPGHGDAQPQRRGGGLQRRPLHPGPGQPARPVGAQPQQHQRPQLPRRRPLRGQLRRPPAASS